MGGAAAFALPPLHQLTDPTHGEFFGRARPVTTMVEVSALIDARLLVEIEATAIA